MTRRVAPQDCKGLARVVSELRVEYASVRAILLLLCACGKTT